jgi:hypothetical protein
MEEFNLNSSGVTAKQYILGRRHDRTQLGMLRMGRYLAIDGSTGAEVYIDCLGPHSVLICGKRGYGKSYTMGTLIEEIAMQPLQVSENMASIIIDSMGIFWTLVYANSKEESLLSSWNLKPKSMDVQIFVPKAGKEDFPGPKTNTKILAITPTELSGDDWSTLFNVSSVHPLGVLITRIINDLKAGAGTFALDDILSTIDADTYADTNTKQAAINYFDAVKGWGLFEKDGLDIHEIIRPGGIWVIDVSSLPDTVRSMVVGILAKKIYQERVVARKQYELNKITDSNVSTMPMVWMFLDEAHLFLPRDGQSAAREVLVNEWLRQGRQPGLSLVLATQRPAALHPDVLSQSDIIICHRLTSQDDISALEKVRPTYMRRGIADSIRKMDEGKGVAFIVDDTSEASHVVQMRPRLSWHGGDEPSSLGLYGK